MEYRAGGNEPRPPAWSAFDPASPTPGQDEELDEAPESAHSPEQPPAKQASSLRVVREIAETLLLAVILYVGVRAIIMPYEVEGASMEPSLHNQERVLVNRVAYSEINFGSIVSIIPGVDVEDSWVLRPFGEPGRGDVIVLQPPNTSSNKPYIKRVIGLPGEVVTFQDGYVHIDGVRLNEEYLDGPVTECRGSRYCEVGEIPPDHVFVLGDNRGNSSDSRTFGIVPIANIQGKAFFANWPLDAIGPIRHGDYDR